MTLFEVLYAGAALFLAVYGLQAIVLTILYLRHRREKPALPALSHWPRVTIQLPLFNEMYVAERLLEAVTNIQYPRERLQIQVLDDSTDETARIVKREVNRYQAAGAPIELIPRRDRAGYKAGALAAGLKRASGELIAIFDADFVPRPDFLLRTVPYFSGDQRLGMLQTRWGHTNAGDSSLTRAQAIALDGHFTVEQAGRQRSGLFMSFNGTAGIWRRECIESSGGWSADTLCEDLDLSYRAQLAGWRCLFLPEVESPAEIPPQMAAFKRQQSRWAQGSIQCLLKLWRSVLRSDRPLWVRLMGLVHMGAYAAHPMTLLLLLTLLPLLLQDGGIQLPLLAYLSVAGLGPPLMYVVGQRTLHRDWPRRLLWFPVLMLIGTGLAWKNTGAVIRGLSRRPAEFRRTPKFQLGQSLMNLRESRYALGLEWSNAGELLMAGYSAAAIGAAIVQRNYHVIPFLGLYLLGFGYVALYDVWQRLRERRRRPARLPAPADHPARTGMRSTPRPGSLGGLH